MADDTGAPAPASERRGVSPSFVIGVVVAVLTVIFVLQNTRRTKVEFLAWDVRPPLWIVLLVTAVAAIVAGELLGTVVRRRRRR
jgi:uncharacterized integral membrane protein